MNRRRLSGLVAASAVLAAVAGLVGSAHPSPTMDLSRTWAATGASTSTGQPTGVVLRDLPTTDGRTWACA